MEHFKGKLPFGKIFGTFLHLITQGSKKPIIWEIERFYLTSFKRNWLFICESHHFATLEAEKLCEISQKIRRFYSSAAGVQNETSKLPKPDPVPSSPAVDDLASLRACVM